LPWPVTIAAATAASWIERPEKELALEKLHATAGILESKEDDREKKWLPGEGDEEEEEEEEEAAEASCGNTAVRLCAMAAAAVRVVPVRVLLPHCAKSEEQADSHYPQH
jgi:hypothetical protein